MNNTAYLSFANMPFWNVLPMGVSNFGGDTQVFTIPEYATGRIGTYLNTLGQASVQGWPSGSIWNNWGANNPFPYPNINPYFPLLGPGQTQPGQTQPTQPGQTNPTQPGKTNPAKPGQTNPTQPTKPTKPTDPMADKFNKQAEQMIYSSVQASLSNISLLEQTLDGILAQVNLSDTEKTKVKDLLTRLNNEETRLHKLLANKKVDHDNIYKELQNIEDNVRDIMSETTQFQRKKSKQSEKAYKNEELEIADAVSRATDGAGTDDELLEGAVSALNKNNILPVLMAWEDSHGSDYGETMIDAVLNDATEISWVANTSQKAKLVRQMSHALKGKAQELGIYEDCKADFEAVAKEMKSIVYIDDDVCKDALNRIAKKIAEAEGRNYQD